MTGLSTVPPVEALAILALALPVLLLIGWGRRKPTTRARWATRRDLRPLAVPAPVPGRITLGTAGRQLLAAEPQHSLIVFGPTGSGKTLSVVEPALLEWPGPAVVTTVKAGVLAHTAGHRSAIGPVYVYDPTGSTGRACSTWTPLIGCGTWTGASQMAGWLVAAAGEAGNGDHARFWTPLARKLLAPLLFAAGASSGSMADVVRWVDTKDTVEVKDILHRQGINEAINAFTASCGRPTETGGSVYATAETILDVYTDPQVAASAESCEITPAGLLDTAGTLYLVAPAHAQDRLRPLFEALVMSVVREAQDRAQAGKTVTPGLLLLLDEAGNTAPLRDLPGIASTGREQGIQTISVWQDLAQVTDRYGRQATTVVNNHRGKLALAGIADLGTLDYLSRLLGDTEVDRTSVTHQAGGGQSRSTSTQQQRLAPADQLRQLPIGQGLLVYGSTPAARLTLRRADRGTLAAAWSATQVRGDSQQVHEPVDV